VRVPWSHLKLGPVGFNGKSLVKGRSKVWVSKDRDGPGRVVVVAVVAAVVS